MPRESSLEISLKGSSTELTKTHGFSISHVSQIHGENIKKEYGVAEGLSLIHISEPTRPY